jgi:hypothetical protein
MTRQLRRIWSAWSDFSYFAITKLTLIFVWGAGILLLGTRLISLDQDTTPVTNAAFAILTVLAGHSFSAARAIVEPKEHQDRVLYAAERFFHGAILLLTASVIKYAYLAGKTTIEAHFVPAVLQATRIVLGFPVPILFLFGLNSTHTGLLVVNTVLWQRLARRSDFDRFT